jgi:hypothetical protein
MFLALVVLIIIQHNHCESLWVYNIKSQQKQRGNQKNGLSVVLKKLDFIVLINYQNFLLYKLPV